MGCYDSMTSEGITQAVLSEVSDLALTHGREESAKGPEDSTLSRWCETERALAEVLTDVADLALTHGSKWKQGVLPPQQADRCAA